MGLFSSKGQGYFNREDWGALVPLHTSPFHFPLMTVFVTSVCSLSAPIQYRYQCRRFLKELQNLEMFDKGLPDIAYNFYVGDDGSLYEGRGWYLRPNLTVKENPNREEIFTIAYIRAAPEQEPNDTMISSVKGVIEKGIEMSWISEDCEIKGLTEGLLSTTPEETVVNP